MRMHGWFKEPARHSLSGRGVKSKRGMPRKSSLERVPVAPGAKFELGQVVITPAALRLIRSFDARPDYFLRRHASGDWGDLGPEDTKMQNDILENGRHERLMSAYKMPVYAHGEIISEIPETIWVITEWDRSVTTVLLPEDY